MNALPKLSRWKFTRMMFKLWMLGIRGNDAIRWRMLEAQLTGMDDVVKLAVAMDEKTGVPKP